ncbi:MAG: FAD-binding oxidoreductase [Flavobacteriaceae bacterium]|nr:FAD-binding oxidoreductase [Flavobacteriaceae bacterium]
MPDFFSLSVKEVTRVTPSAVPVLFDVPTELKKEFKFIPGQYIDLKKELNGEDLRRAYSICSSLQSAELRIGIKKMSGGKFSVYANSGLKAGDHLDVSIPKGNFVRKTQRVQKINNYLAKLQVAELHRFIDRFNRFWNWNPTANSYFFLATAA